MIDKIISALTPKDKLSDFEIEILKANPVLAYQMIADQALGYGRLNGERKPIPEIASDTNEIASGTNEIAVREKYGDAVVDEALRLFGNNL